MSLAANPPHPLTPPRPARRRWLVRRLAAIAFVVGSLFVGAVAFAAWTSNGSGSGTVTATTAKNLTLSVTGATGLYPSGTANVPFTVTNPNPYAVTLSKVTLKSVAVDKPGCTTSTVTGANLADTDVIPAGGTSVSRSFPVSMSNAAEDACQGAVFTLTLEASGASS